MVTTLLTTTSVIPVDVSIHAKDPLIPLASSSDLLILSSNPAFATYTHGHAPEPEFFVHCTLSIISILSLHLL